jgi:AraC family transcriptional regulator
VVEYVEGHLDAGVSLDEMAAAAHLSAYHFARQFKAATGLPPHQYVILRRVERAKQMLRGATEVPLAEVAALAGFSDQTQFTRHFKRLVGATPGQFRATTRIAWRARTRRGLGPRTPDPSSLVHSPAYGHGP